MHKALLTVSVLAFSASVSGCLFVGTGALVGGSTYMYHDGRTYSEVGADASLGRKVGAKLSEDATLHDAKLTLNVYKGVVMLYGRLPTRADEQRSVQMAGSVEGVRKVASHIDLPASEMAAPMKKTAKLKKAAPSKKTAKPVS